MNSEEKRLFNETRQEMAERPRLRRLKEDKELYSNLEFVKGLDVALDDSHSMNLNYGNVLLEGDRELVDDFILELVSKVASVSPSAIAYLNISKNSNLAGDLKDKVNVIEGPQKSVRFLEEAWIDRDWFNFYNPKQSFKPNEDTLKVIVVDSLDELFKAYRPGLKHSSAVLDRLNLAESIMRRNLIKKGYIIIAACHGLVPDEFYESHFRQQLKLGKGSCNYSTNTDNFDFDTPQLLGPSKRKEIIKNIPCSPLYIREK